MAYKGPFIWETHEYFFQEKTSDWYWAVGIIAVSIAILSVIFGDALFALLIIVAAFALSLFASRRPEIVRFEVSKKGVMIDRTLYPYATLDSFWVEDNRHVNGHSKLIIKSRKAMVPLIAIPLDGTDPDDVRDFLLENLLEDHHPEPLGQKVLEYFGF
ncbi:MAG TPA: hypothetical protein VGE62_03550 [Candidatus Paceibacterota bacterium]